MAIAVAAGLGLGLAVAVPPIVEAGHNIMEHFNPSPIYAEECKVAPNGAEYCVQVEIPRELAVELFGDRYKLKPLPITYDYNLPGDQ